MQNERKKTPLDISNSIVTKRAIEVSSKLACIVLFVKARIFYVDYGIL